MKKRVLIILLFLSSIHQQLLSQENVIGVATFDFPSKNSLKFNKYIINPAFSFVREDESFLNLYNKIQWTGFDNAPTTYFLNYSSKLGDDNNRNNSFGVGLFQRSYGVLNTFGAIINFAHNVEISRDENNLTFGLNLAYINSGLSTSKVITGEPDPILQNTPTSSLISINPGVNLGLGFIDIGVSANNLFYYNFSTSKVASDDPGRNIEAHVMYTGYTNQSDFFEKSKFAIMGKGELYKDKTAFVASVLYNVPKAGWLQAGYNTINGFSGGVGFNLGKRIGIGYNFEKPLGNFSSFGLSHEIALAYKIDGYGDYVVEKPIVVSKSTKSKQAIAAQKSAVAKQKEIVYRDKLIRDKAEEDRLRRIAEAEKAARLKAEAKADSLLKANRQLTQAEKNALAKAAADAATRKAKEDADRLEAERKAKEAADAATRKAKEDADRLAAERKAKEAADAATRKAKEDADRLEAERKAKEAADAATRKAKEDADRLAAERKAKEAADKSEKDKLEYNNQVAKDAIDNRKKAQEKFAELNEISRKELETLKSQNDKIEAGGVVTEITEYVDPSIARKRLEDVKNEIALNAKSQEDVVKQYEIDLKAKLLEVNNNKNDAGYQSYLKEFERFKAEKEAADRKNAELLADLDRINAATVVEKNRRIKKAVYVDANELYTKGRAALKQIKENTPKSTEPLKPEDFDYGNEELSNNQIFKKLDNVSSGFYLVLASHKDVNKRDAFLTKAVAAGEKNIDFFYNVSSSTYYIYYQKFESIEDAQSALNAKGNKPYNGKMVIIKVEN